MTSRLGQHPRKVPYGNQYNSSSPIPKLAAAGPVQVTTRKTHPATFCTSGNIHPATFCTSTSRRTTWRGKASALVAMSDQARDGRGGEGSTSARPRVLGLGSAGVDFIAAVDR